GSLDFEADAMARHPRPGMRAMYDEAAGRDRPKPNEALLDPVARGSLFYDERACQPVAPGEGNHRTQAAELGTVAKMQIDLPASVRALEGGAHHLGRIETLGQEIGDMARRAFARNETGNESGGACAGCVALGHSGLCTWRQGTSTGIINRIYTDLSTTCSHHWLPLFPDLPTG